MVRGWVVAAAALLVATTASAQMNLETMQKANGLAEIIKKSKPCKFSINQPALEKYYAENGLANPEVLSFISANISLAAYDEPASEADCTISKVTARSIGILQE